MSKHWPGAYKLRVRSHQKCHFFVQLGVKKVAENEEGTKRGRRDEKGRKMVPKREPKVVKHGDKNEAEKKRSVRIVVFALAAIWSLKKAKQDKLPHHLLRPSVF